MADGFDVAACMAQPSDEHGMKNLGHAYGFIYRRLLNDRPVPLVPILVNTFYPPNQPLPRRCFDFGRSIARAVAAWDETARVVAVGSGGLSHFVIDEAFDQRMLRALASGDAGGDHRRKRHAVPLGHLRDQELDRGGGAAWPIPASG